MSAINPNDPKLPLPISKTKKLPALQNIDVKSKLPASSELASKGSQNISTSSAQKLLTSIPKAPNIAPSSNPNINAKKTYKNMEESIPKETKSGKIPSFRRGANSTDGSFFTLFCLLLMLACLVINLEI